MKRIISLLLTAALLAGLLALPAMAADFVDITDSRTAENAATLRMLGVVDGVGGGRFQPNGKLTRAQFCKMAEVMLGNAALEPACRNRTIFPDVRSNHWARGWINLAASGEQRIIAGMPDGTFRPDSAITYAQAMTILVRMLGYSDADAGNLWPQGYLELGAQAGLTRELPRLSANSSLTRAQAVQMFCNLLLAKGKNGGQFLDSLGTAQQGIILSLNATMDNGEPGGVYTSAGTFAPAGTVSEAFVGRRGTLVLDGKGRLATFLPESEAGKTVVVAVSDAGFVADTDGVRYLIAGNTPVYTAGGETKTYADVWMSLPGAMLTLYSSAGKVDGVFWGGAAAGDAVVVAGQATAESFAAITGGETIRSIYKNGRLVNYSDLRAGDVATFSGGVLNVSDQTVTGYFENAAPNPTSPETITVMGGTFRVLPTAWVSLAGCKIGGRITLRLTADGAVAAVDTAGNGSDLLAMVTSCSGSSVSMTAVRGGFQLSGDPGLSQTAAEACAGQLVLATATGAGHVRITPVGKVQPGGPWEIEGGRLGSLTVSPNVKIYEQVRSLGNGCSRVEERSIGALQMHTVPADNIQYYHQNAAGEVDAILLLDVTGDCYTYGILSFEANTIYGELGISYNSVSVKNNGEAAGGQTASAMPDGVPGGIVLSATKSGFVVGWRELKAVKNVPRSAFTTVNGQTYFSHGGLSMPVSASVQCGSAASEAWFQDLAACRAFSNDLTVYYDEGGKVRVVLAN